MRKYKQRLYRTKNVGRRRFILKYCECLRQLKPNEEKIGLCEKCYEKEKKNGKDKIQELKQLRKNYNGKK
jgi:hypothetical protein